VRKHLSRIKGAGWRAPEAGRNRNAGDLRLPHDDPSAIASGPTVPDRPRWRMRRAGREIQARGRRPSAQRSMTPGTRVASPGSRFARAHFELIARPKASLDAAIKLAATPATTSSNSAPTSRASRSVAADHARLALRARAEGKRMAILSGGELTVTVRGNGRGGPNQEYALALATCSRTRLVFRIGSGYRRRRRRRRQRGRSAGAMIDRNTFAKMKSSASMRTPISTQRRHRLP